MFYSFSSLHNILSLWIIDGKFLYKYFVCVHTQVLFLSAFTRLVYTVVVHLVCEFHFSHKTGQSMHVVHCTELIINRAIQKDKKRRSKHNSQLSRVSTLDSKLCKKRSKDKISKEKHPTRFNSIESNSRLKRVLLYTQKIQRKWTRKLV